MLICVILANNEFNAGWLIYFIDKHYSKDMVVCLHSGAVGGGKLY
jgi:hypothetical protein